MSKDKAKKEVKLAQIANKSVKTHKHKNYVDLKYADNISTISVNDKIFINHPNDDVDTVCATAHIKFMKLVLEEDDTSKGYASMSKVVSEGPHDEIELLIILKKCQLMRLTYEDV